MCSLTRTCSEPVFLLAYPNAQASKEASERANSRATPSHIDDHVAPKKPEGQDAAKQARLKATDNDTSHATPTAPAALGVRGADTKKAEPLVKPMQPEPAPHASPVSLSLSLSLARARARSLSLSYICVSSLLSTPSTLECLFLPECVLLLERVLLL